jgi:predicted nucleotidyltransferase
MDTKSVIQGCKNALESHYRSQFRGLFLYGSVARGEEDKPSDIDLLVLLSKPFDYFDELRKIIEILYPVQLKSEHLISAKPVAADEFDSGMIHLYRMAKREGMAA